ncbi:MAG: DUF2834 domain-containing protein [Candidatus Acidiferrales bacterium]
MKPKTTYLFLSILGAILPYTQFLPWATHNGLNTPLFLHQLFSNQVSAFFALDVIVSAVCFLWFARIDSVRLKMRGWTLWLPPLATLTVGVSLALPLFLYLREVRFEENITKAPTA